MAIQCSHDRDTGTIEVVLSFKRDELLYDIRNAAYVEGSVLESDNNHVRHTIQDVGEEGNVDRITRVMSLAVAKCKETLYAYTKQDVYLSELDDELQEPGVYGIVMKVPEGFSQTTLFLLEQLIHEYIVCSALADWLSITYPAKADAWAIKANDAETEIRCNLLTRRGYTRRSLRPF